jgi:uncharacterized protein YecE (DUF72 family)
MTAPGVFYPEGVTTPEKRLRYYSSIFPLVEVDSTYYALPAPRMAQAWSDRTPDDFTFNVKVHALMTGQPSEVDRLPREIREMLPAGQSKNQRVYAKDLPTELIDAVWSYFINALSPLRATGKLGAILLQFPRWVIPSRENLQLIENALERAGDAPVAVELRNHRWFGDDGDRTRRTVGWFRDRNVPLVMVDGPQGLESSVPSLATTTSSSLAMLRLHGRRAETWEKQGVPTVERYRWYYTTDELAEWVPKITETLRHVREVHVLMNNCYGNYGAANALQLGRLLQESIG